VAGVAPALLAASGFAVFQLLNRRALSGVDVRRGTAALLAVGAALLLLVAAVGGSLAPLADATPVTLLFFSAAGFVHFFCGWTFLGMAQVRIGVARTGILASTVPLFGSLFAAGFLGEHLGVVQLLALATVVGGVVLIVSARGGTGEVHDRRAAAIGTVCGLTTAMCWSVSPVLIRYGLADVDSPIAGAAVGMAACAVAYGIVVLVSSTRVRPVPIGRTTWRLLVLAGVAVSLSIWMQWTALALTTVAVALALMQLTGPIVVVASNRLAGEPLGPAARRIALGTLVTVAGSTLLVLTR
jgi:drug/metabolite transporter (DMT)-like permease